MQRMNCNVRGWNALDKFIFKIENYFQHLKEELRDNGNELPEPEEMIEAATEQLRKENIELKKIQYPAHLISQEDKYYCPHCKTEITQQLIEQYRIKCCIECGKRLLL